MVAVQAPAASFARSKPSRGESRKGKGKADGASGSRPEAAAVEAKPAPVRPLTILQVFAVESPPQPVKSADIRAQVEALEGLAADDPARADRLYRLARLHADAERYHRYRVGEIDARIGVLRPRATEDAAAEIATLDAERLDAIERRGQSLASATRIYEQLVLAPAYKEYRRMDQALVALMNLYTLGKQEEKARPLVKRLKDEHPGSLSMPDAYLAFAEYFFDEKDWDKALTFYQRMLAHPESPRFNYARYKEGWSHLGKGDYQKALGSFVALLPKPKRPFKSKIAAPVEGGEVEAAEAAGSEAQEGADAASEDSEDPAQRTLAVLTRESRKSVAWTFALAGGAAKAWPFFARVLGDKTPRWIETLASYYAFLDNPGQEAVVYGALLAQLPDSTRRCTWQASRARAVRRQAGTLASPAVLLELGALGAIDVQLEAEGAPDELQEDCHAEAGKALAELAARWDAELRGADAASRAQALPLFERYAKKLAPKEQRYELSYAYAAAVASSGRACDAADAYLAVFRADASDAAPRRAAAAKGALDQYARCDAGALDPEAGAALKKAMADEAVPLVFHGGDARKARQLLKVLAPEAASALVEQLAELYGKAGRKRDARHLRD